MPVRDNPAKSRASTACLALLFCLALLCYPALAATPIKIGCSGTTDCGSAIVAQDFGIFARHGIDAELVFIGVSSNIPAALVSDSVQVGGTTMPVFLVAADAGLDLVGIAGGAVMGPAANQSAAAVERPDAGIATAQDFVGKKVAVPGIGAFLQILFKKWLMDHHVDPATVNFVEVPYPNMFDVLKSRSVDAVLSAEPPVSRMVGAGIGHVVTHFVAELGRTEPVVFYAATRSFAEANAPLIARFRAAIAEAAVVVNTDKQRASIPIAAFTKQRLDLVQSSAWSLAEPRLVPADFRWWIDVLDSQQMLNTKLDPNHFVVP